MNIQIKRKGIISLFAFVLFAIVAAVFVTSQTGSMTAFAAEQEANILAISYDASIKELTHLATIEENFEDDKVIVILDHQKSRINGIVSLNDFSALAGDIEFISIKDEFKIADIETYQKSNRNFRQILSLTLKESGKENVIKAVKELEKIDGVLVAQPEYIYGIQDNWSPNDTFYGQQWALTATHGMKAENAWNITRGNNGVTVGIMENGIRTNHPDLTVVAGNFTPATGFTAGHGTHVAGIIAAIGNNNRGITGVSQSQIAVLSRTNLRTTLEWAQNNNIRAINASYYYTRVVNGATVPALPDANHATAIQNYNGLFVASAGNSGRTNLGNTDNTPQYPSGYGDARNYPNINNVLSVGSLNNVTTTNAQRSDFSCFGTNSVHIYAPGGNILSTYPDDLCDGTIHAASGFRNCEEPVLSGGVWLRSHTHQANGYHFMNGTSMAAPQVTGVAALLLSVNPNLTPVQLRDTILNNTDSVTIQVPVTAGGTTMQNQTVRRLNAFRAVSAVAFTTSNVSGGISITGFRTGYTMPNNTNLILPDSFAPVGANTQQAVVAIGNSAFANQTQLSQITIPSSVTSIGENAFSCCSELTSLSIPSGVSSIKDGTFYNCDNLETVGIPNSVTNIGSLAFSGCAALSQITIPNTVTSIGEYAFSGCDGLTSLSIPNGVTSVGNYAFYFCTNLENITIPGSVTNIGNNAFDNCRSLESVTIPNGVASIKAYTFYNCYNLETVVIPNTVTNIGPYAFSYCSALPEITIPGSVLSIGEYAFYNCSYLSQIEIPNNVAYMSGDVFRGCNQLSIYAEAESRPSGWNVDWNVTKRPVVWGYLDDVADGGIYFIKNLKSGLYLDVANYSGDNGALLNQYPLHKNINQQFKLNQLGEGIFELIPMTNVSRRVEIDGGSQSNGAAVHIWGSSSSNAQKFKLVRVSGTNAYKILSATTAYEKCLTVKNGSTTTSALIVQNQYGSNGKSDHWTFELATEKGLEEGQIYLIKNQKSGLYMDVDGYSGDNGAKLNQYSLHNNTNQQFKLKRLSEDEYEIIPMINTTRRVDINGGSQDNGATVHIWDSYNNTAQRFKIVRAGDGSGAFKILTKVTDYTKCITVQSASTANSALIIQWGYGYDGTFDNDHWYFEKYYAW